MRIRLHKSRTTTAMLVASVVAVGGVAAGAASNIADIFNNSPKIESVQDNPGNSNNSDNGKSCDGKNRTINNDTKNENGVANGNGSAADCQGYQTVTVDNPGTQNSLSTITVSASATSKLDITSFKVSGSCLQGTTFSNSVSVTLTDWGSCTVSATQAGNTYWNLAVGSTTFLIVDPSERRFICNDGSRVLSRADCPTPRDDNNGNPQPTVAQASPTPSSTPTSTPTSTPLPVSRVLTPRLTNLTTTYNGRSQGVNVSVEPTSANCKVTYNGSSARPTLAGTFDVAVVCRDGKVQGGTTGTFTINKAPTTLNWNDPEPITTMDELSKVQLNAKANVPGTYSYEEKPGLKLPAGTHELNVSFTPRDERNYLPSSTAVDIDVLKYANKFAPIKVPFNLSSAGLTAKTRPVVSELFLSEDVKQITVYGYVQPSNNKKADMKLSLARANTVAKQIRAISPDVKIVVKAMGATINSACNAYKNKCVIVK